jgi:sugar/nucleoside kinase (ribokinase family)
MHKAEALKDAGVTVVSRFHLGQIVWLGKQREILVDNIKNKESEPPIQRCAGKRVFIIGDLNVDISIRDLMNREFNRKRVGGTGFNAAKAFKETGCTPILFGKIGKDQDGELIVSELRKMEIQALLGMSSDKPTGVAYLYGSEIGPDGPKHSANDYDLENLDQALTLAGLDSGDIALLDGYVIYRLGVKHAAAMVDRLHATGAFVIFDIVPHLIYKTVGLEDIKTVINGKVDLLIGEHRTFAGLLSGRIASDTVTSDSVRIIMEELAVRFLVLRYGAGNISSQEIWARSSPATYMRYEKLNNTGYNDLPVEQHSGFGDRLTAQLIQRLIDQEEI